MGTHVSKRKLPQVKTELEIKYLRKAAKIIVQIFNSIRPEIKAGITERQIDKRIDELIKARGLRKSFKTIIGSGPNGAVPHAKVSDRVIEKDDVIVLDMGIRYKGYCSDLTRTIVLGKGIHKLRKLHEAVKEAQKTGIENIKPGLKISDYVKKINDRIRANGMGQYIRHTLGHGVGTRIHQGPKLSERNKKYLKENIVVTIEPGLYMDGVGGIRIEDMVLVRKNSKEVLTR